MKFSLIFMAILLALGTSISVYGIVKKKDWLFSQEKEFRDHPFLASQNLFNGLIFKYFGYKGVVIVEITILAILWIAWIYSFITN